MFFNKSTQMDDSDDQLDYQKRIINRHRVATKVSELCHQRSQHYKQSQNLPEI